MGGGSNHRVQVTGKKKEEEEREKDESTSYKKPVLEIPPNNFSSYLHGNPEAQRGLGCVLFRMGMLLPQIILGIC